VLGSGDHPSRFFPRQFHFAVSFAENVRFYGTSLQQQESQTYSYVENCWGLC